VLDHNLQFFKQTGLSESVLARTETYLDLLERWNRVHALTSLSPGERFEELILDACLALLNLLKAVAAGACVVDFGSGMGIPAIPVALARPDLRVVAVDASAKKVAFIRQVCLEMGLRNVDPVHSRAEVLPPLSAEAGMAKAVGSLPILLGWWERHGLAGAPFFALKGPGSECEAAPGGWSLERLSYDLPTRGSRHVLKLWRPT